MANATDTSDLDKVNLPDWLVYTGFVLLTLQISLGIFGYCAGWSDPSAPTTKPPKKGKEGEEKESEQEGRDRRISRNSKENLVVEPEMGEVRETWL
jgi:hypothetical protein